MQVNGKNDCEATGLDLPCFPDLVVVVKSSTCIFRRSGAIARSVAMSLGNQEAPQSILASGTSLCPQL